VRKHHVSAAKSKGLLRAIRIAFDCDLDFRLVPPDMPFGKTASLLRPLLNPVTADGPTVWLAPGFGGVGLAELLVARDYPGPGRIHVLRYPSLPMMAKAQDIVEAHVQFVTEQIQSNASFRTRGNPPGGVLLMGRSLGAHVMHEVACRLARQATPISRLILLHSVARPRKSSQDEREMDFLRIRRPRHFVRWLEWTLGSEQRFWLAVWSRLVSVLAAVGAPELALRVNLALSCVVRLKTFRYRLRHSPHPGTIDVFGPTGEGCHVASDAGWSGFCAQVRVRAFPVAAREFFDNRNRPSLVREISTLVAESLAKEQAP
jgi:thioesterase domain-containing protein